MGGTMPAVYGTERHAELHPGYGELLRLKEDSDIFGWSIPSVQIGGCGDQVSYLRGTKGKPLGPCACQVLKQLVAIGNRIPGMKA